MFELTKSIKCENSPSHDSYHNIICQKQNIGELWVEKGYRIDENGVKSKSLTVFRYTVAFIWKGVTVFKKFEVDGNFVDSTWKTNYCTYSERTYKTSRDAKKSALWYLEDAFGSISKIKSVGCTYKRFIGHSEEFTMISKERVYNKQSGYTSEIATMRDSNGNLEEWNLTFDTGKSWRLVHVNDADISGYDDSWQNPRYTPVEDTTVQETQVEETPVDLGETLFEDEKITVSQLVGFNAQYEYVIHFDGEWAGTVDVEIGHNDQGLRSIKSFYVEIDKQNSKTGKREYNLSVIKDIQGGCEPSKIFKVGYDTEDDALEATIQFIKSIVKRSDDPVETVETPVEETLKVGTRVRHIDGKNGKTGFVNEISLDHGDNRYGVKWDDEKYAYAYYKIDYLELETPVETVETTQTNNQSTTEEPSQVTPQPEEPTMAQPTKIIVVTYHSYIQKWFSFTPENMESILLDFDNIVEIQIIEQGE